MVTFLALPMALTVVWSVFERTTFWMEPGFTLFAYETFFTSARAENYLFSMFHAAIAVVISFALGFPIAVFVRRRVVAAGNGAGRGTRRAGLVGAASPCQPGRGQR